MSAHDSWWSNESVFQLSSTVIHRLIGATELAREKLVYVIYLFHPTEETAALVGYPIQSKVAFKISCGFIFGSVDEILLKA